VLHPDFRTRIICERGQWIVHTANWVVIVYSQKFATAALPTKCASLTLRLRVS
jgi:hypothetical protein